MYSYYSTVDYGKSSIEFTGHDRFNQIQETRYENFGFANGEWGDLCVYSVYKQKSTDRYDFLENFVNHTPQFNLEQYFGYYFLTCWLNSFSWKSLLWCEWMRKYKIHNEIEWSEGHKNLGENGEK